MKVIKRMGGVLLHPTSLPGPYGIGELGQQAFHFIDFLAKAGQRLWQILPLGPTGYGNSPYASFSTFAGNPLLISLENLVAEGWLDGLSLKNLPFFQPEKVNYQEVQRWKFPLLQQAALAFLASEKKQDYQAFCQTEAYWLEDFALFMAVKEVFQKRAESETLDGKMWSNYWDREIRLKNPAAVEFWNKQLEPQIQTIKVLQFWFYRQWLAVRSYANARNVLIIGDLPIFVAGDSVDVWSHRHYFQLDHEGTPSVVAGVPPDYFSTTGQLWGNPLYHWEHLKQDHFSWWIDRIQAVLRLVDIVRIDHFRGFEAYWEVKAGSSTAVNGRWVKAPGKALFDAVRKRLGHPPIIAEDLGVITQEVEALRDEQGFPGMKILQFAFDVKDNKLAADNLFLPHNYHPHCIVYPGSHDNDTIRGWYESLSEQERFWVEKYINRQNDEISWDLIRTAYASSARLCIIPAQDLLNLPTNARMNIPSTLGDHNWSWRLLKNSLNDTVSDRLRGLTRLYGR